MHLSVELPGAVRRGYEAKSFCITGKVSKDVRSDDLVKEISHITIIHRFGVVWTVQCLYVWYIDSSNSNNYMHNTNVLTAYMSRIRKRGSEGGRRLSKGLAPASFFPLGALRGWNLVESWILLVGSRSQLVGSR